MITCYLEYVIDPHKIHDFEKYAKMWIPLVNKCGGTHQGYFLPHEGANNIRYALFSFPSLAEYEEYREIIKNDEEYLKAFNHAKETKCIESLECSSMKPVFE
jgi:hypothetical protein